MRLRLAGSSLANIAQEMGVAATTVTHVSQGRCRSRRIERAIASKLGTTPEALWPDRLSGKAPAADTESGGLPRAVACGNSGR